jgi:hypothetical protein
MPKPITIDLRQCDLKLNESIAQNNNLSYSGLMTSELNPRSSFACGTMVRGRQDFFNADDVFLPGGTLRIGAAAGIVTIEKNWTLDEVIIDGHVIFKADILKAKEMKGSGTFCNESKNPLIIRNTTDGLRNITLPGGAEVNINDVNLKFTGNIIDCSHNQNEIINPPTKKLKI